MKTQLLEQVLEESKARYANLTITWKPYKRVIWAISTATTLFIFAEYSGDFTFSILGLIGLTSFLSFSPQFAPPIVGIQLLGRRAFALVTDVLLISIGSFFLLFRLQSKAYLGPLLMLVVWSTFSYIVFCDWRFGGTLGKRLWGLKVAGKENTEISFCKSFIRTFLTLPLPIILGGFFRDKLMGEVVSWPRFIVGEGLAGVIIYSIPMSIMFLGGTQSIADKVVGAQIKRKRQRMDADRRKIKPSSWVLLSCSTFAWGFLLASFAYPGIGKIAITGLPKSPPAKDFQKDAFITAPVTAAQLWLYLPMNIKEPTSVIRKIELFEASPNPFTLSSRYTHIIPPLNPDAALRQLHPPIRYIRVSLAPYVFTTTRMIIIDNLFALGERVPSKERPNFALLQFGSDQKYGLFSLTTEENILLCFMGSDARPVDFPMEVRPRHGIKPEFSLSEIYNLLVGDVWVIQYLLQG